MSTGHIVRLLFGAQLCQDRKLRRSVAEPSPQYRLARLLEVKERALAPFVGEHLVVARAPIFDDLLGTIRSPAEYPSLMDGVQRVDEDLHTRDRHTLCEHPLAEAAQEVELRRTRNACLGDPSGRI